MVPWTQRTLSCVFLEMMLGSVTLHQTIKGALREGLAGPSRRPVEKATGAGARKEKGTLAVPVREKGGGSLKLM